MNKFNFRIPKTLKIGTDTFTLIVDKKSETGNFKWVERTITIGTASMKTDFNTFFNILCHEIFEMWSITLFLRYTRPDTYETYEFHFDHRQFSTLVELSSRTIMEFFVKEK